MQDLQGKPQNRMQANLLRRAPAAAAHAWPATPDHLLGRPKGPQLVQPSGRHLQHTACVPVRGASSCWMLLHLDAYTVARHGRSVQLNRQKLVVLDRCNGCT